MKNSLFKKSGVVLVIFLFVGMSMLPTTGSLSIEATIYEENEDLIVDNVDDETGHFTSDLNLSKYWGNEDMKLTNGTGFFDTYQDENGVWWFIDPNGSKFYMNGVGGVGLNEFYYGDPKDWAEKTKSYLDEWGFNTLYNLYWDWDNLFPKTYYCNGLGFKSFTGNKGWTHDEIPDVFDPNWTESVKNRVNEIVEKIGDDSYLIGYLTDNEMKWGPYPGDNQTLIEVYMAANNETLGKQRVIRFFRERYDNVDDFNRVWKMNITTFDDLNNSQQFGFEGWRVQSESQFVKLKLYRDYPRLLREPCLLKKAEADVTDFSRLVAKTYFNVTNSYLKAADPNHLNLGCRFHEFGVPSEVLEECGNYTDVISINYYRGNKPIYYSTLNRFNSRKYGCVPLDQWMWRYHNLTGKPIIVTEFVVFLVDNIFQYFKISYLRGLSRMAARTQKGRAHLYNWYVKNNMKSPYVIGQFLFSGYYSHLVNIWGEPYQTFVENISSTNKNAIKLHENASFKNTNYKPLNLHLHMNIETLFSNVYNLLTNRYSIHERKDQNFDLFNKNKDIVENPNYEEEIYQPNVVRNSDENNIKVLEEPNIIYVDDDNIYGPWDGTKEHPYRTINDGIYNATDGDTIRVFNGTYSEKLIINKSLTLIGNNSNETIIKGIYVDPEDKYKNIVITIEADNVTITGFNITSEGGFIKRGLAYDECSGILVYSFSDCNISGNNFYNLGRFRIKVARGNNTVITNNVVLKASYKPYRESFNILVDCSNNLIIKGNYLFRSTDYGLWMSRCRGNIICNNVILNSSYGIILRRAHNIIISRNIIQENEEKGIFLEESNGSSIINNNFHNNYKPAYFFDSYDNNYKSAYFFDSFNNTWNHNFWDHPRVLPKLIFGRRGTDGLIPCFNFDWRPLKNPYEV